MTQAPLHTALLATGAALAGACLLVSACSKAEPVVTTSTTTVAAAQAHGTLVPPPAPPTTLANDLTQTAAVSPPGTTNGKLPTTPGEQETLASPGAAPPR